MQLPHHQLLNLSFPLSELLQDHKRSLKLVEGNVKQLTVRRDEFWKEAIATFKNPEFDYTASPSIVLEGEAGVDAGGLKREYGALLCQAIFSATANLLEGPEDRKLPIYPIDGIHSRLFKLAGRMVAYLIIHLDASILCLSPTIYKYIESGCISPEFCSIDNVVDLELRELLKRFVVLKKPSTMQTCSPFPIQLKYNPCACMT